MADPASSSAQILSENDALKMGHTPVQLCMDKIRAAKKQEEDWRKDAQASLKAFEAGKMRFNVWHSSICTIGPALYNSTPVPDARRRYSADVEEVDEAAVAQQVAAQFVPSQPPAQMGANGGPPMQPPDPQAELDQAIQAAIQQAKDQAKDAAEKEDRVARKVADIFERSIAASLDEYPFDAVMKRAVQTNELIGRSVVRERYKPYDGQPNAAGETEVEDAELCTENVAWDRYIRGPGMTRAAMSWEAFEHDLTQEEVKHLLMQGTTKPFKGEPRPVEKRLELLGFAAGRVGNSEKDSKTRDDKGIMLTARVFEFWDKTNRRVMFLSEHDSIEYLHEAEDPLQVEQFFSTHILQKIVREDVSLTPICPYQIYKPQLDEIEDISQRIKTLINTTKLVGFVNGKLSLDFERLAELEDGQFAELQVAVQEFLTGAKTSLADAIWVKDISDNIALLERHYENREQAKNGFYELNGVSDVLRGATDADETAAAQQLKATYGSQRLQDSQRAVQLLARDIFRRKAEIMSKLFPTQTLQRLSGIKITPELEALIRERDFELRIDVETDSTIMADRARHMQDYTAFLQGTAQFMQSMPELAAMQPAIRSPMFKLYGAFAKGFRLNRQAEEALEEIIEQGAEPMNSAGNGPTPEQMQHEQDLADKQAQLEQSKQQALQMAAQMKAQELQAKQQHDAMTAQLKQMHDQMMAALKRQQMQASQQHDVGEANKAMIAAQTQQVNDAQEAQEQREHDQATLDREHGLAAVEAQTQAGQQAVDVHVAGLNTMSTRMKVAGDIQKARIGLQAAKAKPKPTAARSR